MSLVWGQSGSGWSRKVLPMALLALVVVGGIVLASMMGARPMEAQSAESDTTFAFTGYVKFAGPDGQILFPGESMDQQHANWSELLSFDQALLAPSPTLGAGGSATGKAQFEDIVLVKYLDTTSPPLQKAAAMGTVIPTVVIELARWGEVSEVFYRYALSNVFVTRYNVGTTLQKAVTAAGQPRVEVGGIGVSRSPIEEISLAYSKILVQYRAQKPDGQMDGWIEFSWDLARNRQ